jgi:hypothetical protein
MNFKTKRDLKRKSKIYTNIFFGLTIFYGAFLILLIIFATKLNISDNMWIVVGIFLLVFGIFLLFLHSVADKFVQRLFWYKKNIKKYRQLRHTNTVIQLIIDKKFSEAIDIYNKIIIDRDCRDFLYAFIIGSELHATSPKRRKNCRNNLETVLERFDPNSIDLK